MDIKIEIIDSVEWLIDSNNNRCSVAYFGSREEAEKALRSLENCSNCRNCFRCFGCSGCSEKQGSTSDAMPSIPAIEDIHKRVYEAASKPRALDMDSWHSCDTAHCRAGWVVHLAGQAGYDLEKQTSCLFAAMQIYKASGYEISPVRFFDKPDASLEDMRRLAEVAE